VSAELLRRLNEPEWVKRQELLRRYYSQNRNVIDPIIGRCTAQGKRMAIWAGGERNGSIEEAFTAVFDPDATKFACYCRARPDCVEDPQQKYPMLKHDAAKADVVFDLYGTPYNELAAFKKSGLSPEFVLVEDEIWSSKARAHAKGRSSSGGAQSGPRVCSLTILYNPSIHVVDAIGSYAGEVEKAFVFDNSPRRDDAIAKRLEAMENVEYSFGGGENLGLSRPINTFASKAADEGFDWFITFDQDSVAEDGMVEKMVSFAGSSAYDDSIALVAPFPHKNKASFDRSLPLPEASYVNLAIQSGLMHRLSAMQAIGPYDERLFIDEIERDYCARVWSMGYSVIRLNDAVLFHQVADTTGESEAGKYSAPRFYYRTRNMLHMRDKWWDDNPKYADDCVVGIMGGKGLNKLVAKDERPGEKAVAMMLAYADYDAGVWPRYEESLQAFGVQ